MNEDSFDTPFSAGRLASIHPGSLVVDFRVTDATLKNYNERYSQWDRSSDRRRAAGEPEAFGEMPVEAREFLSRHAHEIDHMNRFLGTSFGYLCDAIRNQWLVRTGQLIQERSAKGLDPFFPERLYRPPGGTSFPEALKSIEGYARSVSTVESAFVGVDDLLTAVVGAATPPGMT